MPVTVTVPNPPAVTFAVSISTPILPTLVPEPPPNPVTLTFPPLEEMVQRLPPPWPKITPISKPPDNAQPPVPVTVTVPLPLFVTCT